MRIGFFIPTMNWVGGAEWVTVNMINSLKEKGYDIVVYSAEKINVNQILEVYGRKISFNKEVHFYPYIFNPQDWQSIYSNILRSRLFKFKCDILIDTFSNKPWPWVDVIYFQAGTYVSSFPNGLKSLYFLPFKTASLELNKGLNNQNKKAAACSQFVANQIKNAIGLNVEVLHPPVSDFFKVSDVHPELRRNIVVTVSRLVKDKRLDIIPQIAKLTSDNLFFVIAGYCRSYEALISMRKRILELGVERKILLIPNVTRERLRELLQKSKVYLHTAEKEAFGISIIEAMSSGCVPIVPDSGGPTEFVPRRLRYTTVEEAASLVESAMLDWSPQKSEEFVQVTENFSIETFSKKFLQFMRL